MKKEEIIEALENGAKIRRVISSTRYYLDHLPGRYLTSQQFDDLRASCLHHGIPGGFTYYWVMEGQQPDPCPCYKCRRSKKGDGAAIRVEGN